MWICTQAFHVPKRGSVESEYEDAFFPDREFQRDLSEFRCAVADGASESAFSGEWARLLVRGYCRRRVSLERLQRRWLRFVTRRPAPWYLEAKIKRGPTLPSSGCRFARSDARSPSGALGRSRPSATVASFTYEATSCSLSCRSPNRTNSTTAHISFPPILPPRSDWLSPKSRCSRENGGREARSICLPMLSPSGRSPSTRPVGLPGRCFAV